MIPANSNPPSVAIGPGFQLSLLRIAFQGNPPVPQAEELGRLLDTEYNLQHAQ